MTRAQQLSILTCIGTYVLIVIGGVVRITNSGLGCPDWPLCHGQIIPPAEKAVLIEFSHRTTASVVGLLIIAMAVLIWRQHREPLIRRLMVAVFPLLALQIVLGGITVKRELPAVVVAFHHGTAMLLLALLILITTLSIMSTRRRSARVQAVVEGSLPYPRWALLAALATFALLITGSYVAASGSSLAFSDWPLFAGRLLPEGGRYQYIQAIHRATAAGVGVIIIALAEYTRRTQRRSRPLIALAALAVCIYAAQVVMGAANIWSGLNQAIATGHLALATLLWSTLVLISILSFYEAEPAIRASRPAEAGRPELAHGP